MKPLSVKRKEAEARNEEWARIPLVDQLACLEREQPMGARRQKERIKARIKAGPSAVVADAEAMMSRLAAEADALAVDTVSRVSDAKALARKKREEINERRKRRIARQEGKK